MDNRVVVSQKQLTAAFQYIKRRLIRNTEKDFLSGTVVTGPGSTVLNSKRVDLAWIE